MEQQNVAQQQLRNQRTDDFVSAYSNNVVFEQSVWDLKITFGQLDQSAGVIEQHTAITIPWSIAKLSLYYLAAQVAGYEAVNGKIMMTRDTLPTPPFPPPVEYKDNSDFQKVYTVMTRLYEEFMKGV
jgi:hypothetical protein